ncbi:hypothetical protein N0V95_000780 [Ascochyta clinopodiicola]|nr:hypothetical protein N0V95_000780 [Ascochyta clinopodiicola]
MTGFYYGKLRSSEHTIGEPVSKLPVGIEVSEDEQKMFDNIVIVEDVSVPLPPAPNFPVPSIWGHPNSISYTPGKPWNQADRFYVDDGYVQANPATALLFLMIPTVILFCCLVWLVCKCSGTSRDRAAPIPDTDDSILPDLVCNPTVPSPKTPANPRNTPPSTPTRSSDALPPGLFKATVGESNCTGTQIPLQGRSPSAQTSPPAELAKLVREVEKYKYKHQASQALAFRTLEDKEKIEQISSDRITKLEARVKFLQAESAVHAQLEVADDHISDSEKATIMKSGPAPRHTVEDAEDEAINAHEGMADEIVDLQPLFEGSDEKIPSSRDEHSNLVQQSGGLVDTGVETEETSPASPTVILTANTSVNEENVVALPEQSTAEPQDQPTGTTAAIIDDQTTPFKEKSKQTSDKKAGRKSGYETTGGAKTSTRPKNDGEKLEIALHKKTETDTLRNGQTPVILKKPETLMDRPAETHRCDVCSGTFTDTETFTFVNNHYVQCREWKNTWEPKRWIRTRSKGFPDIEYPPSWRYARKPSTDPEWLVTATKVQAEQQAQWEKSRAIGDGSLEARSAPFTPSTPSTPSSPWAVKTPNSALKADVPTFNPSSPSAVKPSSSALKADVPVFTPRTASKSPAIPVTGNDAAAADREKEAQSQKAEQAQPTAQQEAEQKAEKSDAPVIPKTEKQQQSMVQLAGETPTGPNPSLASAVPDKPATPATPATPTILVGLSQNTSSPTNTEKQKQKKNNGGLNGSRWAGSGRK